MKSSKPTHRAICKSGVYTAEDGTTKNRYANIGVAWSNADGSIETIRLNSMPLNWDGVIYMQVNDHGAATN